MPEQAFAEIQFEKYGRWLAHSTGSRYPFAACGPEGVLVWESHPGDLVSIGPVLDRLRAEGFCWPCDGQTMQRKDIDETTTLLYIALGEDEKKRIGWLALLVSRPEAGIAPMEWDHIAEALEDIAVCIRDEYQLKSELNGMAEELLERYEELHLIYDVDTQIRRHDLSEGLFKKLLQNCAEHLDVDVVAYVSPHSGINLSVSNLSKPIHNLDLVLVEMRGDLYRFIHSAKQSVVLNDMKDPRRAYIFTDMAYKVMACPIFKNDQVSSILVLLNHQQKRDFSNSDRKLAEVLANQLSGLSRMHDMLSNVNRMVAEVSTFNKQMAAALIEAVEAKDPYTRGHSERVNFIAMEIGRAMALAQKDLENLHWASLLHDVGKIGIPDAVLCKPGRLTADEYTFIMVHPERSYEILRHIDHLKDAVPGARHHQEKYDGTGYPHRLKGEAIPLLARIIAVADTYDSITGSRAYRAGRSHEAAIAEIDRISGTQLDPLIIDAFSRLCITNPTWIERFGIRRETVHV